MGMYSAAELRQKAKNAVNPKIKSIQDFLVNEIKKRHEEITQTMLSRAESGHMDCNVHIITCYDQDGLMAKVLEDVLYSSLGHMGYDTNVFVQHPPSPGLGGVGGNGPSMFYAKISWEE